MASFRHILLLLSVLLTADGFPGYIECDRDISAGTSIMHSLVGQSHETVKLNLNNRDVECGSVIYAHESAVYSLSRSTEHSMVAEFNPECGAKFSRPLVPQTAGIIASGTGEERECLHRTTDGDSTVTFTSPLANQECTLRFTFAPGFTGVAAGLPCTYTLLAKPSGAPTPEL
mmetsp:Transcript_32718/g.76424  ORF Transcript_32718/g.76424 Transcript_32718/m.76424 type:complete len:173 (-) Transcript_32718:107-625(-)